MKKPPKSVPNEVMKKTTFPYTNPFLWVPSSYLSMGLIYVTVSGVAMDYPCRDSLDLGIT